MNAYKRTIFDAQIPKEITFILSGTDTAGNLFAIKKEASIRRGRGERQAPPRGCLVLFGRGITAEHYNQCANMKRIPNWLINEVIFVAILFAIGVAVCKLIRYFV